MKYKEAYRKLSEFGKRLIEQPSLEEGLPMIAEYARSLVGAERCSIFIHDKKRSVLWTMLSDGISEIIINDDEGIAGASFQIAEPIIVNDVQNDPRFFSKIDHASGFVTKSVIAVPILNSNEQPIGVFQMINSDSGTFDEEDLKFITFFSNFVKSYIELAIIARDRE